MAVVGGGNEGLSVFVGYTNSATGYLEGWSATGSSTFGSGYEIDPASGSPTVLMQSGSERQVLARPMGSM